MAFLKEREWKELDTGTDRPLPTVSTDTLLPFSLLDLCYHFSFPCSFYFSCYILQFQQYHFSMRLPYEILLCCSQLQPLPHCTSLLRGTNRMKSLICLPRITWEITNISQSHFRQLLPVSCSSLVVKKRFQFPHLIL